MHLGLGMHTTLPEKRIPLDIYLLLIAGTVLVVLQIIYGTTFNLSHRSFLVSAFTLALVLVVSLYAGMRRGGAFIMARRVARVLLDWAALVGLVFIYGNLRDIAALYQGFNITHELMMFENYLFGKSLTVYTSPLANVLLTDFFTIIYGLYLVIPLALALYLYLRGYKRQFELVKLALVAVMFAGFILYIVFPASPPRFTIEYAAPISSALFNTMQAKWDAGSFAANFGAFPSLHVGISAVATFACWQMRKRVRHGMGLFIAALILSTLISLSTIYLRHHWVLDIVAGYALAYAAVTCSTRWRLV